MRAGPWERLRGTPRGGAPRARYLPTPCVGRERRPCPPASHPRPHRPSWTSGWTSRCPHRAVCVNSVSLLWNIVLCGPLTPLQPLPSPPRSSFQPRGAGAGAPPCPSPTLRSPPLGRLPHQLAVPSQERRQDHRAQQRAEGDPNGRVHAAGIPRWLRQDRVPHRLPGNPVCLRDREDQV